MKKNFLLLSISFLLSCSSNDDNNSTNNPDNSTNISEYVGKWKLTGKTNSTGNNIAVSDCEDDYNWTQINSDGASIISKFNLYSSGGAYYCNANVKNYNCTRSNNILTFTNINSTGLVYELKYEILSVNSLTLIIKNISSKTGDVVTPIPQNQQISETFTKI